MSEETKNPMEFVSQGDIEGRLRLLRYGLIVAVIVVFLITWLVPYVFLSAYTNELIKVASEAGIETPAPFGIADSLVWAIVAAIATAIAGVILYFVYRAVLQRTMGG
ncbi:MAG: hypothetical protein JXB47_10165 [Anaerolineae bacterium]|nr:hypothetical protein [Anaerolineae bacterium]